MRFGNVAHILGTKSDINIFIRYEQRCVPAATATMALWRSAYPDDDRYEQAVLISSADLKKAGLTPETASAWDFTKALAFAKAQVVGKLKLGSPLRGTHMMVGKTPSGERAALYQYHPASADYTVPDAEKTKAAEKADATPADPTNPTGKKTRKKPARRQSGYTQLKILGLLKDPLAPEVASPE